MVDIVDRVGQQAEKLIQEATLATADMKSIVEQLHSFLVPQLKESKEIVDGS